MTNFLAKVHFPLIKVVKSKNIRAALTSVYYLGQET